MEPVSRMDLRLERTIGQPMDAPASNFEGLRSMEWVMESLTAVPAGSSSIVHNAGPSAVNSGLIWFTQRITIRRGGSISRISPSSKISPVLDSSLQRDPAVHWL